LRRSTRTIPLRTPPPPPRIPELPKLQAELTREVRDGDEPFGFENQRVYPEDIWIEPGDTITTTCTHNAPATFGPGTNQEMCYWFAMHYPPLALADNAPLGNVIHGPNTCLGL
jgi:Copper type II ascorbate-dependent monooxygenase, C-terminal domain